MSAPDSGAEMTRKQIVGVCWQVVGWRNGAADGLAPGDAADAILALRDAEMEALRGQGAHEIVEELARARAKHPAMHSAHEGWAVIFEELDELWDEVKAQHQDKAAMRKEALQVAAMALRFIEDICDGR